MFSTVLMAKPKIRIVVVLWLYCGSRSQSLIFWFIILFPVIFKIELTTVITVSNITHTIM